MRPKVHRSDLEYSKYIQLPYPVVFGKLKVHLCGDWDDVAKLCKDFVNRATQLIIADFDENLGSYTLIIKSSYPEVFMRKSALKICSNFTGEHQDEVPFQ